MFANMNGAGLAPVIDMLTLDRIISNSGATACS